MSTLFFIILTMICTVFAKNKDFIIDYTLANKNRKMYLQVPDNELIFSKYQAYEPMSMFEGPLKGHGFDEMRTNNIILDLRAKGIQTYVDYFTVAKNMFYINNKNYEICWWSRRSVKYYKSYLKKIKDNHFKAFNKYIGVSIPYSIISPIGKLGILTSKLDSVKQYKYKNSNVYSIKGILDDNSLYTVQITDMYSGLKYYIYYDLEKDMRILPQYRSRVYDFVASNSVQLTLMLRGKRMHWVDLTFFGDYFYKKLGIKNNEITSLDYSHENPSNLKLEDYHLDFYRCVGNDLEKVKKIIHIVNFNIKKLRTNEDFWRQVLKNYAKDVQLPYEDPYHFFYTKENFKMKKEIDAGIFDFLNMKN